MSAHQSIKVRRYRAMNDRQRRAEALDEAFFDLSRDTLRSPLLGYLQNGISPTFEPALQWLADRGITPARAAA